ncbi:MAG: hypothetical protein J0I84_02480 [Terrimonas sp.]|nr:hypothetical protein [Terrimonas sp.]OJY81274.1 MAG: hypothetical protein BGP13_14790 [Sphingobacteriales bacterium 40-81]
MKRYLLIVLSICTILACNNKNAASSAGQQNEDTTQKEFYPISGFIQAQIKKLDALPLAVIKYTTINNKTDTSIIEKNDFAAVAGYFTTPDITAPGIKNQFEETSFIDASISTISLTYLAKNDTIALRKADVLLNQDNSRVTTIYIEKKSAVANESKTQKMLWTADRNMQVTTIEQAAGSPEKVIVEKYVWDDKP